MANPKLPLFMQVLVFSVLFLCCCTGISADVPDDVVYTDLHKTVRKGDSVVLTCRFRGTPMAVYWKKGDDPRTAPNLVSWIPTDDVTGLCEGERPCQIMEMNANRSLVIKEVSIAEQGRYICRVSSYRGILIHNFTDISVFSPPMEPFPIINKCQMISSNNTKTTCTISTSHSVEISCTASGYFPDIDLYFLHGTTSHHTKNTIEVSNLDGTKSKTIYAIATASEISYVCFASNIPGLQEQRTTAVLVNLVETPSPMPTVPIISIGKTVGSAAKVAGSEVNVVGIAVGVTFAVIIIILLVVLGILYYMNTKKTTTSSYPRKSKKPKTTDDRDAELSIPLKLPAIYQHSYKDNSAPPPVSVRGDTSLYYSADGSQAPSVTYKTPSRDQADVVKGTGLLQNTTTKGTCGWI